jgi:hypothetical protein
MKGPFHFVVRTIMLWLTACAPALVAQEYVISTVAGGSPMATPILGVNASLDHLAGLASDSAGDVYISSGNCIYRVDLNGVLTLVAGNSRYGYSGDGGPATDAELAGPTGLAVDSSGTLYIADLWNLRLRKVTPDGIITTIAGTGTAGGPGDGDGGPATNAQLTLHLCNPYCWTWGGSVAVDSVADVYVTDAYAIRKISPDGIIDTFTVPTLDLLGMAIDLDGALYIADWLNHRVQKITPDGTISTVAGDGTRGYSGDGGPAISAQLSEPADVAVDSLRTLYIADGDFIRRVGSDGVITTIAGTGIAGYAGDGGSANSAPLWNPSDLAVDQAGNLYINDGGNGRVRKIAPTGLITTVAGNGVAYTGDGGMATRAKLIPSAVAADAFGNLFIADSNRIRKVTPDGIIRTVAGNDTSGYSGDGGPAILAQLFIRAV